MQRGVQLSAALRYGSGNDAQGLVLELGARYERELTPLWRLGFGLGTSWANAQYMQTYFGVTDTQSQQSGLAAYTPGAGWRDLSANVGLGYALAPGVTVAAGVSASSLVADAKNSPVVSAANRVGASLSIRYAF